MNTLPARSSRMNAVVARAGSRRSARTPMARVAAATSNMVAWPSSGTKMCTPLDALGSGVSGLPAPLDRTDDPPDLQLDDRPVLHHLDGHLQQVQGLSLLGQAHARQALPRV